jgi:hypothetical protein
VSGNIHIEDFLSSQILFESFFKSLEIFLFQISQNKKCLATLNVKRASCSRDYPYWGLFVNFPTLKIFLKVSWSLSKSYKPKQDKTKNVWRLWTSSEPDTSGNVNIKDFLLISLLLKYFWKSFQVSQSLIIPKKSKQNMFGDSERQTSQLCQGLSTLKTSCWFPSSQNIFESLLRPIKPEQNIFGESEP